MLRKILLYYSQSKIGSVAKYINVNVQLSGEIQVLHCYLGENVHRHGGAPYETILILLNNRIKFSIRLSSILHSSSLPSKENYQHEDGYIFTELMMYEIWKWKHTFSFYPPNFSFYIISERKCLEVFAVIRICLS